MATWRRDYRSCGTARTGPDNRSAAPWTIVPAAVEILLQGQVTAQQCAVSPVSVSDRYC